MKWHSSPYEVWTMGSTGEGIPDHVNRVSERVFRLLGLGDRVLFTDHHLRDGKQAGLAAKLDHSRGQRDYCPACNAQPPSVDLNRSRITSLPGMRNQ
jgi:hypothetical protein